MTTSKKIKPLKRLPLVAVLVVFLLPLLSLAQVEITEVMYDLEGSDSGREWIEIYNTTTTDVDLFGWKLFEAETNHKVNSVVEGGATVLPAQSYALIVDNFEKFKVDYPSFSGLVFDSAFSLSNSGENFILRNSELVDIDGVNYLAEWGSSGDGQSLQKVNSNWVSAIPTPGGANSTDSQFVAESDPEDTPDDIPDEVSPPTTTTNPPIAPVITYKIEPQVFAYILPTLNKPIAGASFVFEGDSRGLLDEPLQNAVYQWTFGDGGRAEGQKVLYTYQYPGDYVLILQVVSGKYTGIDRLEVKVLPSDILISDVGFTNGDQFIEIYNPSTYELNLSWWILRNGKDHFTFPKNTIILPKKYLKFSSITTGFVLNKSNEVSLLYPNGSVAFKYEKKNRVTSSVPAKKKVIVPISSQVASIQKSVELVIPVEKPVEIQPSQITEEKLKSVEIGPSQIGEKSLLPLATSSSQDEPELEKGNNFLNKWNISLAGVVSLAVAGLFFSSKLDD